jgi:nuclear-control-of-ATPase protein 2
LYIIKELSANTRSQVDIDQTLTGIDKLLKSQELTFAFVGVAPALAIVYFLGGFLGRSFLGLGSKAKFGGPKRRKGVWADMRRVERLLISHPQHVSPASPPDKTAADSATRLSTTAGIPHLTTGLLLMSLTRLRTYAVWVLPAGSGIREGFLEDVEDLEDVRLGRVEKVRVVERMWRCWGGLLGWGNVGGGRWQG